jgi:hypothetical protein
MGTAFKIFLTGMALAVISTVFSHRIVTRTPPLQDDAGNPAPN